VFRSSDGGDTFTISPWSQAFGGRAAAVTFTTGPTAYIVNTNQYGVYGQVPSVSHDYGVTWSPLPSSAGVDGQTQTIDCDMTGRILVLSDTTSLFLSRDQGRSWMCVYNASSSTYGLRVAGTPLYLKSGLLPCTQVHMRMSARNTHLRTLSCTATHAVQLPRTQHCFVSWCTPGPQVQFLSGPTTG
jgi:photosystem II stability/assembly factor-like uncharacterized protein